MVKLDKNRVLDREVPFFYAKKMGICLCYVMDQAGIKHMEMPAHRLEDCLEFENMTIPKEAISFQGQKSDDVWVMMSKIDPQHMAEKMQEMIYDKDLYEIYVHNNTDEIIKFEDLHFNEYDNDTDTDEEIESIPWYGTGYIYTTHHKSGNYLSMTPQDIKSELERYVIGQEEACKQTAIMMYQHLHGHRTVGLLAGPTGSGKSYITESLQKIFPDVVYLREISNLTRDGWSGQKKASTLFKDVKDPYGYGGKIHPLIVLDECDKCFSPNFSSTGECVSEGVQSELLAAIHGADIEVKIESVEWVSNASVEGKLFDKNTNAAFDASNYPDAVANGVFFVALEDNGHVYAYVLNSDDSVVQIADIDSKLGGAMALDYDTYENVLWIAADNGYENRAAKAVFNGNENPDITIVKAPSGVDTSLNNEGFAIADKTYTVNGQRPVYRFQDGVAKGALSVGHLACSYINDTQDESEVIPSSPDTDIPADNTDTSSSNDNSSNDSIDVSTGNTNNSGSSNSSSAQNEESVSTSTNSSILTSTIIEQNVPMAESVNEALSMLEIVATGNDTNLKLDLLRKYSGKGLSLLVHLGNGVGFTVSSDIMDKIDSDIELGSTFAELNGFAEGFQTYQILPKKESNYNFEISTNKNVGAVNSGKTAYIFQKNSTTNTYERVKVMPLSEIGNVAFTSAQISDVIVLVQE